MKTGIDISAYLKEGESEGVWLDFRDGCQVRISYLSPRILRKLKKESTRKEFIRDQVVENFSEQLFNEKIAQEAICDWTGFCDKKGEPVPCTPENSLLLMDNWTEFNLFVQQNALADLEVEG